MFLTCVIVLHLAGKLQQLLSFSEDFPQELGRFLEPHDNLSWMHQIVTQDYNKVQMTTIHCAIC